MGNGVWKALAIVGCAIVAAIFGVALVGGCGGVLETTTGTVPMRCHWAYLAMAFVAPVALVAFALACVARTREGRRVAAVLALVALVVVALLPSPLAIGVCANEAMSCNLMAIVTWILAGAGIVVAVVLLAKADPEAADKPKMEL